MQHNCILPRALRGSLFASPRNDDPQELFKQINATLEQFRDRHTARLNGVEASVGNLTESFAAMQGQLNAGGGAVFGASSLPTDPDYSRTFASYFRRGDGEESLRSANAAGERAMIQAAMSVGDNSSGGYLAPLEWDRRIGEALRTVSPMRRIAKVQTTGVNAFSTLWNNDQWGSGWVGETAARPQTTNASLSPIVFASGEIYAMPATTQRSTSNSGLPTASTPSSPGRKASRFSAATA